MKNKIIFYCSDPELKTNQQLLKNGGSGTLLALINIAWELSLIGFDVEVAGNCRLIEEKDRAKHNLAYIQINSDSEFVTRCKSNSYMFTVVVGHALSVFDEEYRLGQKVVYWPHNWINVKTVYEYCNKGWIDQVIFVSKYHFMKSWRRVRFNPCALRYFNWIHNSLDLSEHDNIINKNKIGYKKLRLAFLSYPSVNKGLPEVVNIFNELKKKNFDVELNVFGSSALYSSKNMGYGACEHLLFKEGGGAKNGIILHGLLGKKELFSILDDVDIAISGMTGSETFCYALAESMARGLIVISSKSGGQVDYIEDGQNGYLVSNCFDAVQKICELNNKTLVDVINMKKHAKKSILKFDHKYVTKIWVKIVFNTEKRRHLNLCNILLKGIL